jgi:O-antigen ligase
MNILNRIVNPKIILLLVVLLNLLVFPLTTASITLPKFYLLIVIQTLCLYSLSQNLNYKNSGYLRYFIYLFILFLIIIITSGIMAKQNFDFILIGSERHLGLLTYSSYFTIFVYFLVYVSRDIMIYFERFFFVQGFFLTIYGLLEVNGYDPLNFGSSKETGISLTFGNSNFASAYLGILISFNLYIIFFKKLRIQNKIIVGILVIFQIWLILKTLSIQGVFLILIGIILVLILFIKKINLNNSKLLKKIIFIFLLVSLNLIFLFKTLIDLSDTTSFKDRLDSWKIGIQMISDYPLFGLGVDSYGDWYPRYKSFESLKINNFDFFYINDQPHNIFVQIGTNFGVIAVFIYLLIFFTIIKIGIGFVLSRPELDSYNYLVIIWVLYLVQSLVSIETHALSAWAWVCAGCIVGLYSQTLATGQSNFILGKPLLKRGKAKVLHLSIAVIISFLPLIFMSKVLLNNIYFLKETKLGSKLDLSQNIEIRAIAQRMFQLSTDSHLLDQRLMTVELLYFGYRQPDLAIKLVKDNSIKYPQSLINWTLFADIAEREGLINLAKESLEKAVSLDPLNNVLKDKLSKFNNS